MRCVLPGTRPDGLSAQGDRVTPPLPLSSCEFPRAAYTKLGQRMKPISCLSRLAGCAALAVTVGLAPGCGSIFVAKHKVLVDAIAAPGVAKPAGQSYRLVAKKAMVTTTTMQVPVVKACIDAALVTVGMFDAPPNVAPDMFIEVNYGTDSGPRADPAQRETFLQLSARANPDGNLDRSTGAELWDVRVGVMGVSGRPETAMPLLASVAANYIATDTKAEAKVEIPQNAPSIAAVRETAIKALEAKAPAPADAPTGAPSSSAPSNAAPGSPPPQARPTPPSE
jgi:hypothetical protein